MILHLATNEGFHLRTNNNKNRFSLGLSIAFIGDVYEHYEGEYIINPKITSQTLETKDKIMDDDVTVNEIYYNETENLSGGLTAQIGDI